MNAFWHFTQKFKMAAKNGRKTILGQELKDDSVDTLGVNKTLGEIALSGTISKINVFFSFTQKFKTAAKNGRKTILGKSRQFTLQVPWG